MYRKIAFSIGLFIIFSAFTPLLATAWRGGEISYRQTGPATLEATVTLYANIPLNLQETNIAFNWDDGTVSTLPVVNGPDDNGDGVPDGELITPSIRKLVYQGVHTFSEEGAYRISVKDPNRVGGILNLNPPNSEMTPLYLEALVTIAPEWAGQNHSPLLLESPIDAGNVGQPFEHTANAFDIDDDSLVYELIVPLQDRDLPVPNYRDVSELLPGPDNQLTLDPATGLIRWDAPVLRGSFSIAFRIRSYRNGVHIGTIVRDMLIDVDETDNPPPGIEIDAPPNVVQEVAVGDTVLVQITGEDASNDDLVNITATSGLFAFLPPPAGFTPDAAGNPTSATFEWIVDEAHLRQYPIQIVLKAREVDNADLSDLAILRYRVTEGTTPVREPVGRNTSIRVFPNPSAGGQMQLELNGFSSDQPYHLYDATGHLLTSGRAQPGRQTLTLPRLEKGVYLLRVGDRWAKRIVIGYR